MCKIVFLNMFYITSLYFFLRNFNSYDFCYLFNVILHIVVTPMINMHALDKSRNFLEDVIVLAKCLFS